MPDPSPTIAAFDGGVMSAQTGDSVARPASLGALPPEWVEVTFRPLPLRAGTRCRDAARPASSCLRLAV